MVLSLTPATGLISLHERGVLLKCVIMKIAAAATESGLFPDKTPNSADLVTTCAAALRILLSRSKCEQKRER